MVKTTLFLGALAASFLKLTQAGWNANCNNNIVTYHGNGGAPGAQNLKYYCTNENSYADVFITTFVAHRDSSGQPIFLSDSSSCNVNGDCRSLGSEVSYCQSLGKTILISIGGATGDIIFSSPADAQDFAQKVWDAYLGGKGTYRPFGTGVVFDGVDLDIENKDPPYWGDFTTKLRQLYATDSSKKYLIASAPQPEPIESQYCATPDFLKNAWVDFAFVQFYNNPGFDAENTLTSWAWWDSWARQYEKNGFNSKNPNVKIVYGLPGDPSPNDAGSGYRDFNQVKANVASVKAQYPLSFGGGGTWDDAWSYNNVNNGVNFLQNFKNALGTCSTGPGTTTSTKTITSTSTKTTTTTSTSTVTPPVSHNCPNTGSVCPSSAPCCSQWGYCGSTSAYCGTGCDAGASYGGKCVASAAAAAAAVRLEVAPPATNNTGFVPKRASINDGSNFLITSLGIEETPEFVIKVAAGSNPIKKVWSLTLPKKSGVISSSRGQFRQTKNGIIIASVPTEEEESVGSLRFTVKTRSGIQQLDLAGATFTSN